MVFGIKVKPALRRYDELIEVDENAPNDESPIWSIGAWDLDTDAKAVGAPVAASQGFEWEGGEYAVNLNIGKWLNQ
jgi:hypothetical protein